MKQDPNDNALLHGYSERGVVNAVFEELVALGNNNIETFRKFLGLLVPWADNVKLQLPEFDSYEVYIEPSLSDFGEPDVLVFLKQGSSDQAVLFIEAKLETFAGSAEKAKGGSNGGIDYTHNSSSVLHEIFLKTRFWSASRDTSRLSDGVAVYKDEERKSGPSKGKRKTRSIGSDSMVLKLARRLCKVHRAFFVALTTDVVDRDQRRPWGAEEVERYFKDIFSNNEMTPEAGEYWSALYLLSWQEIWTLATKHGLTRIRNQLKRNETKFSFASDWAVERCGEQAIARAAAALQRHVRQQLKSMEADESLAKLAHRQGTKRTLNVGKLAMATAALRPSFEHDYLELYIPKERVPEEFRCPFRTSTFRIKLESDTCKPDREIVGLDPSKGQARILDAALKNHLVQLDERKKAGRKK